MTVDEVGRASRQPAVAHLDILHAQDVPAVVHVLLEVFVLDEKERRGGRGIVRRVERLQAHHRHTTCNSCSCIILLGSAEAHE